VYPDAAAAAAAAAGGGGRSTCMIYVWCICDADSQAGSNSTYEEGVIVGKEEVLPKSGNSSRDEHQHTKYKQK